MKKFGDINLSRWNVLTIFLAMLLESFTEYKLWPSDLLTALLTVEGQVVMLLSLVIISYWSKEFTAK